MSTPTLQLEGGRKKAARRPRVDAVVKLRAANKSDCFYARVYPPGKRARYRSLFTKDTDCAERAFAHVKAQILRDQNTPPSASERQEVLPL